MAGNHIREEFRMTLDPKADLVLSGCFVCLHNIILSIQNHTLCITTTMDTMTSDGQKILKNVTICKCKIKNEYSHKNLTINNSREKVNIQRQFVRRKEPWYQKKKKSLKRLAKKI